MNSTSDRYPTPGFDKLAKILRIGIAMRRNRIRSLVIGSAACTANDTNLLSARWMRLLFSKGGEIEMLIYHMLMQRQFMHGRSSAEYESTILDLYKNKNPLQKGNVTLEMVDTGGNAD